MIYELRKVIKRLHYPLEVMLVCVRWYACAPQEFRPTRSKDLQTAFLRSTGIETMHMIRKGRMACLKGQTMSAAEQFYSLAF